MKAIYLKKIQELLRKWRPECEGSKCNFFAMSKGTDIVHSVLEGLDSSQSKGGLIIRKQPTAQGLLQKKNKVQNLGLLS